MTAGDDYTQRVLEVSSVADLNELDDGESRLFFEAYNHPATSVLLWLSTRDSSDECGAVSIEGCVALSVRDSLALSKSGVREPRTERHEFTDEDRALRRPSVPALPDLPQLDPERNRERYVREKLSARSLGLELEPFPAYTCRECPHAPDCWLAFTRNATNGECAEELGEPPPNI